jgi:hypothetical protein
VTHQLIDGWHEKNVPKRSENSTGRARKPRNGYKARALTQDRAQKMRESLLV